jgi:hypothetical protein
VTSILVTLLRVAGHRTDLLQLRLEQGPVGGCLQERHLHGGQHAHAHAQLVLAGAERLGIGGRKRHFHERRKREVPGLQRPESHAGLEVAQARLERAAVEVRILIGQGQIQPQQRHRPVEQSVHPQRGAGGFVRRAARGHPALDLDPGVVVPRDVPRRGIRRSGVARPGQLGLLRQGRAGSERKQHGARALHG